MAIIVKGKIRLCQTSLSDWNPERVNGIFFYDRYQDFVKLFSAKIPEVDFEKHFAQPVLNSETNAIEWFCSPLSAPPSTLLETPDVMAENEKLRITQAVEKASSLLSENDCKYLSPILMTLHSDKVDSITYHNGGHIVFGIWGMIMKKGKVISDVIIDDIKDHRTHHVTYNVQGNGTLSFSDIVRKHGHVLGGEKDIPSFQPAQGYLVRAWLPESPSGMVVDKQLQFTLVFEKDPLYVEPTKGLDNDSYQPISDNNLTPNEEDDSSVNNLNQDEAEKNVEEPSFKVHFVSDDRGKLYGTTTYEKKNTERVLASEIPKVEALSGYRFAGWDKQPIDYIVQEDTTFTAQYDEVNDKTPGVFGGHWLSGCLNWLLMLLLLSLIGLLLWFLLGHHNLNFCGCDCEEGLIVDTITPSPTPPSPGPAPFNPPVNSPCDELQYAGSNDPKSFVFDMGQQDGAFLFEYATGENLADKIVIYDGKSRADKIIFDYYGTTGGCSLQGGEQVNLNFSSQFILVDITPDLSDGTCWEIKVHCPQ